MIVFLTLVYLLLLLLLTRTGKLPNTRTTWLTVIPYDLVLLIFFFIPMQWGAPAGDVRTMAYSVAITPNVSGEVIEVPIETDTRVERGDILFKIDPTQYQAALDALKAKLKLSQLRLEQSRQLASVDAGTVYELQSYQAEVDSLQAQVISANWNLEETVVRAPSDGIITYVVLRPGARVSPVPLYQSMAFIDTSETMLGSQIPQNFTRHIEPGQAAEVTFKAYPGEIFSATVLYVIPATGQGQLRVSGSAMQTMSSVAGPFFVRLKLDDPEVEAKLIPGSMGSVAIYTDSVKVAHIIRRVMIRLDSIMNYFKTS